MIKRRTYLQRHTPLARVPMKPTQGPVKMRRQPQTKAERVMRDKLKDRSGGVCETQVPNHCTGRAEVCSHRKRRSQSSRAEKWSLANVLHSCLPCEQYLTEHGGTSRCWSYGWTLHPSLDPERIPVWRRGEWVWLRDDGGVVPLDLAELATWVGAA